MATMSATPHLNHVPTMAGGVGAAGVRAFYRDHLVGKFGVLVQIGLLKASGLPVTGPESARKVLNPQLPARTDY